MLRAIPEICVTCPSRFFDTGEYVASKLEADEKWTIDETLTYRVDQNGSARCIHPDRLAQSKTYEKPESILPKDLTDTNQVSAWIAATIKNAPEGVDESDLDNLANIFLHNGGEEQLFISACRKAFSQL